MIKQARHIIVLSAAAIMTLVSAGTASADQKKRKKLDVFLPTSGQSFMPVERQTQPRWAQRKISASEAKSIAVRRVPGAEVVDIALNGNTYRVRLIRRDGRVVDVFIDAVTGRVR